MTGKGALMEYWSTGEEGIHIGLRLFQHPEHWYDPKPTCARPALLYIHNSLWNHGAVQCSCCALSFSSTKDEVYENSLHDFFVLAMDGESTPYTVLYSSK